MEEHEYYDTVLKVVSDLEGIEKDWSYYEKFDWNKLEQAYEDIGRLRTESRETKERQLVFLALERMGIRTLNNIRRMLYDIGGISHDD